MSKNVMNDLLDMVCDEIESVHKDVTAKGKFDTTNLNLLDTLIDIKKDLLTVMGMEGNYEFRENNNYQHMNGGHYNYNNGYQNMNGYSNHGNRGYYIQPYYMDNAYGNMPMNYGNGYSRASSEQEMIQHLRSMATNATPQKQEMIHNFISQLENMN